MKATFDLAVNDTLNRLIQRSTPSNLAYVAEMQVICFEIYSEL